MSWLPAGESYHIFFNRDELRTRQTAVAPAVHRSGDRAFIAPLDRESQGSWVAATEDGVSFCLLNRYEDGAALPQIPDRRSRGEIIMRLGASACDRRAAGRWFAGRPWDSFYPFTVAVVDGAGVSLFDWDGTTLRPGEVVAPGLVHTSSSYETTAVIANRTALFSHLDSMDPARLRSAHASHLPSRGAASVCMHRDDASTVSFTEVQVDDHRVTMTYREGPACTPGHPHVVELRRRTAQALG